MSADLDFIPNVSPTQGSFNFPSNNAVSNATSISFTMNTPHGNGDGAYDYTDRVQLRVFDATTNQQVYNETLTTSQAQKNNKTFGTTVDGLTSGKSYYADFRHQDSWGSWSPFSARRNFSIAQVPDAPELLTPSVKLDIRSGYDYRMTHNHPEGRPAKAVEIELYNAAGTTRLWASGTRNLPSQVAAGAILGTGATGGSPAHPTLAWGTGYSWRARVQDTLNAWSNWTPRMSFRTNSTPTAPTGLIPANNARTGNRNFSAAVNDPDGDQITAAQMELVRVSNGQMVTGYPRAMQINAAGNRATYTVPESDLAAGAQYRWRVRATDGIASGYGPYSPYSQFSFAVAPSVSLLTPSQSGRINMVAQPSAEYDPEQFEGDPWWEVVGASEGNYIEREQTDDSAFGGYRWRGVTKDAEADPAMMRSSLMPVDPAERYLCQMEAKRILPERTGEVGEEAPELDPVSSTLSIECYDSSETLLDTLHPSSVRQLYSEEPTPYWTRYGGAVWPASMNDGWPEGTTQVRIVFAPVDDGAGEVAFDAFSFEIMPKSVSNVEEGESLPPPGVLATSQPRILENVSSIQPNGIASEAGELLLVHVMHRAPLGVPPVGWTRVFTIDRTSSTGTRQYHTLFSRTTTTANEPMPTIRFTASSARAIVAALRCSAGRVAGYSQSVPSSEATEIQIDTYNSAVSSTGLWFVDSVGGMGVPHQWTISGTDTYQKLYGDEIQGRLTAFRSTSAKLGFGPVSIKEPNLTGAIAYSGAIVLLTAPVETGGGGVETDGHFSDSSFFGYADPDIDTYGGPNQYSGEWFGEPGNSESDVVSVLWEPAQNFVMYSYSHPNNVSLYATRVVVQRYVQGEGWRPHHNSGYMTPASTPTVSLPDYLFRNEGRYRVKVFCRDNGQIDGESEWVEFATRFTGPPEIPVFSYQADSERATITVSFESTGLDEEEFGGIEVARSADDEPMKIVDVIRNAGASQYVYEFPVSDKSYRLHVRQVRLVGPERIEGRWRTIDASVSYPKFNFLKNAHRPDEYIIFQHSSSAGPNQTREAPNESYVTWGSTAPTHLFGETRTRADTTSFLLFPHHSQTPEERMRILKKWEQERPPLVLLSYQPEPEKVFIALSGTVRINREGPLARCEIDWQSTSLDEPSPYEREGYVDSGALSDLEAPL